MKYTEMKRNATGFEWSDIEKLSKLADDVDKAINAVNRILLIRLSPNAPREFINKFLSLQKHAYDSLIRISNLLDVTIKKHTN